jgi:hypothetical protein
LKDGVNAVTAFSTNNAVSNTNSIHRFINEKTFFASTNGACYQLAMLQR